MISPKTLLRVSMTRLGPKWIQLVMTAAQLRACNAVLRLALVFILAVSLVSLTTSCSGVRKTVTHRIKADYDVKVDDPGLLELTTVTASIDLAATGEFTAGTYTINNVTTSFPEGTKFKLQLTLPISNPKLVSTKDARGTLTTSKQWTVNGISAPLTVRLDKGMVSGEVDIIRTLGAFFVDLIQPGSDQGDVRNLIRSIRIEEAKLHLREGSTMTVGEKSMHFGPNSTLSLSSIAVDKDLNYQGLCVADLAFLPGSKWVGEKVDCFFSGGRAQLRLLVSKSGDSLFMSMDRDRGPKQLITLEDSRFHFGKNKRSSALSDTCAIDVQELSWHHKLGETNAELHMLGKMDFVKTHLLIKTDIHQTAAFFPAAVPATMQLDFDKSGRSTHFATEGIARAEAGRIDINKKETKLSLWLSDALVGPVDFDKLGGLQFKLVNGKAKLKQLDWQGSKSKFTLATAGDSTIAVPDMMLEQSQVTKATKLQLPLKISLGAATLKGPKHDVKLSDLNGNIQITVDKEVQLESDLGFTIPGSSLLGGEPVDVKAKGLNLSVFKGKTLLKLDRCVVSVPQEAFQEAIRKKVPTSFTVKVNKAFSKETQWRYKNANASEVKVNNLDVQHMEAKVANQITFNAAADVVVDGTVEKENLFKKKEEEQAWSTRPWTMSGRVESDGQVNYKFIPNENCSDSQIEYKLAMNIPVPHDVTLDWSHVSDGLMKVIEKAIIVRKVREMQIPINLTGRLNLFSENDKLWRHFLITQLAVKSNADDCRIEFSANANL
ncbi:MAG: hypothetical protein K2W95_20950 [Candidatus Obscuribacterales bacterium]|nr:hypothetical protein [Candidatus Obscuribacterales bacterium]